MSNTNLFATDSDDPSESPQRDDSSLESGDTIKKKSYARAVIDGSVVTPSATKPAPEELKKGTHATTPVRDRSPSSLGVTQKIQAARDPEVQKGTESPEDPSLTLKKNAPLATCA